MFILHVKRRGDTSSVEFGPQTRNSDVCKIQQNRLLIPFYMKTEEDQSFETQ
jgi:hypothetical protein